MSWLRELMGRDAVEGKLEPDYVGETVRIGEQFNRWHKLGEESGDSGPERMRRLWEISGRQCDSAAVPDLLENNRRKL